MKPKHEIISGACFAPTPGPDLGCCGVLAVANFAGVPFADVWKFLTALAKRRRTWKGSTYDWERRKALEHFGVTWTEKDYSGQPLTVAEFASWYARPGVHYKLHTKGHVMTLLDGVLTDQVMSVHYTAHRSRRSKLRETWIKTA